jgi:hypothetical protein
MPSFDDWLPTTAYPAEIDRTDEAQRRIDKARSIYDSTLRDLCVIQTRGADTGDYGYGSPSWTDGSAIACLYIPKPAEEVEGAQALVIDGEIRLPRSAVVTAADRIKVTTLYGLTTGLPQVFEVVQGPYRSHKAQIVMVKLVTDGSGT